MRVDKDVELKWENMYKGIFAQADWLLTGPERLMGEVRARVNGNAPPRIYLVGCGDSHYCGLATRFAFEKWSGIPTEALESLEFSRYAVEYAPAGSWVICVSNSGRVVRTVESAIFARERGLTSIGVTFHTESRLAQNASITVPYVYQDMGFGPGTLSYMASLVALYTLAIRAGELSGRLDSAQADALVAQLTAQSEVVRAAAQACDGLTAELGKATPIETPIFFIGGGPNYGTALFAMAKFIEAARVNAVGQELEEWAHEQYFCTGEGTLTVVLAPPGASVDRAREQLQAVRDVGGRSVVICAADDAETAALSDLVLPIPRVDDELLTPIAYPIPAELFAYHYASSKGVTMLGFNDANRMQVNFRQIFGSRIPGEKSE